MQSISPIADLLSFLYVSSVLSIRLQIQDCVNPGRYYFRVCSITLSLDAPSKKNSFDKMNFDSKYISIKLNS